MSDPLRDSIPYFRTWLAITDNKVKGSNRDQAVDVEDLQKKRDSAARLLEAAKTLKCPDMVAEFVDIVVQIDERLDAAKKKQALIDA
jgi:hypothetical protein